MGSRGQRSKSNRREHEKEAFNGHFGSDKNLTADDIVDYLGVSAKEAKVYENAIWAFTSDYYTYIKKLQNGQTIDDFNPDSPFVKDLKKYGDYLEKYINLAPKWNGDDTYRGINVSSADAKKYKVGQKIDVNRGTASWSSDLQISQKFSSDGDGERVVFRSPTQSKGTSIKHLSKYEHEDEVMVSKHANYTITNIKRKKDGIIYIDVKEN